MGRARNKRYHWEQKTYHIDGYTFVAKWRKKNPFGDIWITLIRTGHSILLGFTFGAFSEFADIIPVRQWYRCIFSPQRNPHDLFIGFDYELSQTKYINKVGQTSDEAKEEAILYVVYKALDLLKVYNISEQFNNRRRKQQRRKRQEASKNSTS